jgi:hypothetical protein
MNRFISLSSKGLANIPEDEQNFEFILIDHSYRCSRFVAAFLSPRVSSLWLGDPTVSCLTLPLSDPDCYFEAILSLGRGAELAVTEQNLRFLISACVELDNNELLHTIFYDFQGEWTFETVLPRLILLHSENCEYESEMDFIASHFHLITRAQLAKVSSSLLCEILSSGQLKVKSETWLYRLLADRVAGDICLLEFIRLEYLSTEAMAEVVAAIKGQFDCLTFPVWLSLAARLGLPVAPTTQDSRLFWKDCQFDSTRPLDGIIAFLTVKWGGNVAEKGVVDVTASGYWKEHRPRCAADLLADSYFESDAGPNQWLCYDFREMRVRPTHYSVRSQSNGSDNGFHLKTWVVEASLNGAEWTEIDRKVDNEALNRKNATATFACSTLVEARMVRIRQIGKNWLGNHTLLFSAFELFGALRDGDETIPDETTQSLA